MCEPPGSQREYAQVERSISQELDAMDRIKIPSFYFPYGDPDERVSATSPDLSYDEALKQNQAGDAEDEGEQTREEDA